MKEESKKSYYYHYKSEFFRGLVGADNTSQTLDYDDSLRNTRTHTGTGTATYPRCRLQSDCWRLCELEMVTGLRKVRELNSDVTATPACRSACIRHRAAPRRAGNRHQRILCHSATTLIVTGCKENLPSILTFSVMNYCFQLLYCADETDENVHFPR